MREGERYLTPMENFRANSDSWLKGRHSPYLARHSKMNAAGSCKLLEPARKTLHSLEAERVMTVFQDTVKCMEVVTSLSDLLETLPRFSVALGHELVSYLENHVRLQNRYRDLTHKLGTFQEAASAKEAARDQSGETLVGNDGIKACSSGEGHRREFLERKLAFLTQSLRYSVKDILRCFKKNPKAFEAVLGNNQSRSQAYPSLMDAMTSLQGFMKERLLTSPLEQQEKKAYLTEVINREKKTSSIKEKLETKYKAAVKDKQTEISKRNATIAALQHELQLLEHMTCEQQRRSLTDALKQTAFDTKTSKSRMSRLYGEMVDCRQVAQQDKKDHRESETYLRKRTFKMATEVYNWVQKYDTDLDGRQEEYDLYTRMYEADKKELSQLQTQFAVLEKEYNAILEERRLIEEEKARKIENERKMNEAALKIQALWKGYYLRKMLRSKAKKGKKGKKGKK